jgi:hypothetical protein
VNSGKTLFAQLMDFLPWSTFTRIVSRYGGDWRVRTLPCAEQYRAMAFAQLTYRESLRDIETWLSAHAAKLYAMGFGDPVRRSTLADANEARDWRIYAELAQRLIVQARRLVPLSKRTAVPSSPFGFPVDGTGCERSNLRKRRFRVPGSQSNLARQGTCVVLNGWCIEACVGGVTCWAIGAGGDPRKPNSGVRSCPPRLISFSLPRPSRMATRR